MILHGDCLDVLPMLDAESVDAVVTDPPYGLNFMNKKWDHDVPSVDIWREVYRVMRPGAYLLAFFGTRTYHRGVVAIEDAGFEIRDQIAWLYGSGFPKSLDVSKAIDKAAGAEREVLSEGKAVKRMIPGADQDRTGSWIKDNGREFVPTVTAPATAAAHWEGWGTALKPAQEPIVLARKPLIGTVAENVLAHGVGGLNINGCRIEAPGETITNHSRGAEAAVSKGIYGDSSAQETHQTDGQALGRWPANVILSYPEDEYQLDPSATDEQRKELWRWFYENA